MEKTIGVIGSGGREHALVSALRRARTKSRLILFPGNDGMEGVQRAPALPEDPRLAAKAVADAGCGLVVVGPEKPLMEGLADACLERGIPVVGPTARAARIEGSKTFAKALMERAGIPTAPWKTVTSREEAEDCLRRWGLPLVFKADGLAQGKGVAVVSTREEWDEALGRYLDRREVPGGEVVFIEKALSGPEVSFIVATDGKTFVPFPTARDFKRIGAGDKGPNTGGMGVLTPVPGWSARDQAKACEIIERCLWGLAKAEAPFSGFLYAGLMMTEEGPSVLEFNARMGDPEAQILFESLGEAALPLMEEIAAGDLKKHWAIAPSPRVGVVLASAGYPDKPVTGDPIEGLPPAGTTFPDGALYFAGVERKNGVLCASGGRVLTAVGRGETLAHAREAAYRIMGTLRLKGGQVRPDIALRETSGDADQQSGGKG